MSIFHLLLHFYFFFFCLDLGFSGPTSFVPDCFTHSRLIESFSYTNTPDYNTVVRKLKANCKWAMCLCYHLLWMLFTASLVELAGCLSGSYHIVLSPDKQGDAFQISNTFKKVSDKRIWQLGADPVRGMLTGQSDVFKVKLTSCLADCSTNTSCCSIEQSQQQLEANFF